MGFSSRGVSASNSKAKIKLGEKVECVLEKFEVDKDGHLYITVKNTSGSMRHKEFNQEPTNDAQKIKWNDTSTERIKHVACAFIEEEDVDAIEAADFKGWAEQLVIMMEPHYGEPMTAKIVRNKNNFPAFPKFVDFVSTEKAPFDWSSDAKYDDYVYKAVDKDKEADAGQGTSNETAAEVEADDEF